MNRNLRFLQIGSMALLIGMVLAGCKSMQLDYLEEDTVEAPSQVRQFRDIDPGLIRIWGFYKDGSRKMVNLTQQNITFDNATPGPQTVMIRVGAVARQGLSFPITVMPMTGLEITSDPQTTLFKQGEDPNPQWPGMEIRGEWDQMGSEVIPVSQTEITGFMKDQPGRQTITVSYAGHIATFNVDIRSMSGMTITQRPTKFDYLQGERLDLAGLRIVGSWGDGIPDEELNITASDVTGFNANNSGIQHLTVTKNERTVQFDVEVLRLTSISISDYPTTMDYHMGDELDLTGLVLNVEYTGSTASKNITRKVALRELQELGLTVTSYNPNLIQRQTVTLRVGTATTTIPINVTLGPNSASAN